MNRDFNRFVLETQSRLLPVPRSIGVGGIRAGDVPTRVKKEQEQGSSNEHEKTIPRPTLLTILVVRNRVTTGGSTNKASLYGRKEFRRSG